MEHPDVVSLEINKLIISEISFLFCIRKCQKNLYVVINAINVVGIYPKKISAKNFSNKVIRPFRDFILTLYI